MFLFAGQENSAAFAGLMGRLDYTVVTGDGDIEAGEESLSIKQMSLVWERADVSQGTLLVLLALADWANDAGVCWPSVPAIARKARLSDRQVRRILDELEEQKIITVQEKRGRKKGGEYATCVYKLNLTICPVLVDLKPVTDDMEDLTFEAAKPDIRDSAIRKEPSVNTTVIEPSGEMPPEDLPELAFAHQVVEELCQQNEPGMMHAVAGAIKFCVKFEGMTKASATRHLIARAREQIARGEAPNRFWFTDRKWRQGAVNGNGSTSKADQRSADIRSSTGKVFERMRSVLVDDAGSVSQQNGGQRTGVVDSRIDPGNGEILDSGNGGGSGRDGKKSAPVRDSGA